MERILGNFNDALRPLRVLDAARRVMSCPVLRAEDAESLPKLSEGQVIALLVDCETLGYITPDTTDRVMSIKDVRARIETGVLAVHAFTRGGER